MTVSRLLKSCAIPPAEQAEGAELGVLVELVFQMLTKRFGLLALRDVADDERAPQLIVDRPEFSPRGLDPAPGAVLVPVAAGATALRQGKEALDLGEVLGMHVREKIGVQHLRDGIAEDVAHIGTDVEDLPLATGLDDHIDRVIQQQPKTLRGLAQRGQVGCRWAGASERGKEGGVR